MDTLENLIQKQKEITTQIDILREQQKKQGMFELMEIVKKYQLTLSDISSAFSKQKIKGKKRGAVAPKYRDPVSGVTWTGRGKTPAWIAGKDKEQFLISESTKE